MLIVPTPCLTCRAEPLTAAACQGCALSAGCGAGCPLEHGRRLCLWCAAVAAEVAHAVNLPAGGSALLTAADFTRWAEAAIDGPGEAVTAWQYLAGWRDTRGYAPLPIPART